MVVDEDEVADEVVATPVLHERTEMERPVRPVLQDHTVQVVLMETEQVRVRQITIVLLVL